MENLLREIRECAVCAGELPLGPRPVLAAHGDARIAIIGQAPGTRVHRSGIPWNDPSGEQLRKWLDMDEKVFYDARKIAIVPMGFCYPGKGKSGDLPPRRECAPLWHGPIFEWTPNLRLFILIGVYAQKYYLGREKKSSLTETVKNFNCYLPRFFPLVHPSPRNRFWLQKNPWFEENVIPELRRRVREILAGG